MIAKHDLASPETEHARILLAEDDEDLRGLLARWLTVDGYRVTPVASGPALLARLAAMARSQDPPVLVITDDRMPGGLGSTALRRLREQGWSIPLILISSFATEETVLAARRIGARVLPKPFEIDHLRALTRWLAPRVEPRTCVACGSTVDVGAAIEQGAKICGACRDRIA